MQPFEPKPSYGRDELLACGDGIMFGPGNAQLPKPNMLMIDRIAHISQSGGEFGKGEIVAELDIRPDLWFFECHFPGDPVMPGCLGLDAMWQLVGFYLGWRGNPGRGRALGAGEVKFTGQILPSANQVTYPARFQVIAAMNPCPCGYQGHPTIECQCSPPQVIRYQSRLSGPLLDRFVLHVEVPVQGGEVLMQSTAGESTSQVRQRVVRARDRAVARGSVNAVLSGRALEEHCVVDDDSKRMLVGAMERLGLSARALHRILRVARTIAENMQEYAIVMTKSTVPVGTADKVRAEIIETLARRGADLEFDVVSNPEFLKEGAAIADFMKPDRVVVGTDNPRTMELLRALYDPFTRSRDRFVVMDVRSAELTKYAANAMLATKISFMNEMANIAERVGADIEKVRTGIGSDPRIGYSFIYPGSGYGGSCFPKDVKALVRSAREVGYEAQVLESVESVNALQKGFLARKVRKHFGDDLSGRCFALWGLAFKPNTDDMREAPALTVIADLLSAGASIRAFDPVAMKEAQRVLAGRQNITYAGDANAALEGADALLILTEWQEFRSPDFDLIRRQLKQPVIFDGRNLYNPELMTRFGFEYYGVGRGRA